MNEQEISRDFKGIWIPRAVWLNPDLTPLQKMLIAEIDSLSKGKEGCIASNGYLAKFFGVTEGTMAHMVTELRKLGWVETLSFDGRTRRLRIKAALLESDKAETIPDVGIQQGRVVGIQPDLLGERKEDNKDNGHAPLLDEVEAFKTAWNSLPQDFPRIRILSTGRERKLLTRLREPEWRASWREALARMPASAFLSGKTAPRMNRDGKASGKPFVASVDWFLQPDSAAKILEGKYDLGTAAEPEPFWRKYV